MSSGAKGISKTNCKTNLSVEINRPANQVFAWLTQPPKLRQWILGFKNSIPLNGDSLRVGARSKEIINNGGERIEMTMEITELEYSKLLVYTMEAEIFTQNGKYSLTEKHGKTTVNFDAVMQLKPFMVRLIEPIFTKMANRQMQKNFENLKLHVENESY